MDNFLLGLNQSAQFVKRRDDKAATRLVISQSINYITQCKILRYISVLLTPGLPGNPFSSAG